MSGSSPDIKAMQTAKARLFYFPGAEISVSTASAGAAATSPSGGGALLAIANDSELANL